MFNRFSLILVYAAWLSKVADSHTTVAPTHLHKHLRRTTKVTTTTVAPDTHGHYKNHDDQSGSHFIDGISQSAANHIAAEESQFFIERIFWKYGNESIMTYADFCQLIKNIGLGSIEDQKYNNTLYLSGGKIGPSENEESHDDHDHDDHDHHDHRRRSAAINRKDRRREKRTVPVGGNSPETVHYHTYHSECLTPSQLLEAFDFEADTRLTKPQFIHLCPALIYQLDTEACTNKIQTNESQAQDSSSKVLAIHAASAKVWGFSTVAVIIISLVGLLGVAVIPIMQKVFYNHLLQFLVALAVGALSGDALLHLLPHALQEPHDHSADRHVHTDGTGNVSGHSMDGVHKGMCALAGIYFFFLMERILTIVTDLKRKRKKKKRNQKKGQNKGSFNRSDHRDGDCEETVMVIHPNKALKNFAEDSHDECVNLNQTSNSAGADKIDAEDEDATIGGHSHHGHGHSHSGQHKVPTSVAAIAWMVILGDGIHNFSDGLAIGAAFANSITGGISTSIAVFCHELPHEIGDFAVLLRAGMSAKQAIIYNIVSSILCFIGMLIGVAIGNITSASLWVFSCVAGIFLYIALVDMLPEMTAVDTKKGEHPFCHLLFQCGGMLLGAGIMLLIAIYEDDLKTSIG